MIEEEIIYRPYKYEAKQRNPRRQCRNNPNPLTQHFVMLLRAKEAPAKDPNSPTLKEALKKVRQRNG